MNGSRLERHLTGADLVRFLDGEGSRGERARHEGHLGRCPRCAAGLDTLRDESRRVGEWLRRYDDARPASRAANAAVRTHPAVEARRSGPRAIPPWLKAAAAILLVAGPVVAVPGVRGWVVDRLEGGAGEAPGRVEAVAPASAGAPVRMIRFVPAPGEFTVWFDAAEPGGRLTLGRAAAAEGEAVPDAGEAELRLTGPAEPVVSSGRLRLRNATSAAGTYSLRLPPRTTAVRLVIGDRQVVVEGADLDAERVVPLGNPLPDGPGPGDGG